MGKSFAQFREKKKILDTMTKRLIFCNIFLITNYSTYSFLEYS